MHVSLGNTDFIDFVLAVMDQNDTNKRNNTESLNLNG